MRHPLEATSHGESRRRKRAAKLGERGIERAARAMADMAATHAARRDAALQRWSRPASGCANCGKDTGLWGASGTLTLPNGRTAEFCSECAGYAQALLSERPAPQRATLRLLREAEKDLAEAMSLAPADGSAGAVLDQVRTLVRDASSAGRRGALRNPADKVMVLKLLAAALFLGIAAAAARAAYALPHGGWWLVGGALVVVAGLVVGGFVGFALWAFAAADATGPRKRW